MVDFDGRICEPSAIDAEEQGFLSLSFTTILDHPYNFLRSTFTNSAEKDSLSKIWSSERKEQVIDSLDPKTHCRFHCIRHKSNQLIDRMIKGEEQRVLEDFDLFI